MRVGVMHIFLKQILVAYGTKWKRRTSPEVESSYPVKTVKVSEKEKIILHDN